MKLKAFIVLLSAVILLVSCREATSDQTLITTSQSDIASISWSLDSISVTPKPKSYTTWTIRNASTKDWAPSDWTMHYNQISGSTIAESIPTFMDIDNPGGGYFIHSFNDALDTLMAGEELSFSYAYNGHIERMSNVPQGIFIRLYGTTHDLTNIDISGIDHQTLQALNPTDAQERFNGAKNLLHQDDQEVSKILPTPVEYNLDNDNPTILGNRLSINFAEEITEGEQDVISEHLGRYVAINRSSSDQARVSSKVDANLESEHYRLDIDPDNGVIITGGDAAGVFYGFQSLIQLIDPSSAGSNQDLTLPSGTINDGPRFDYRGYMLDVARNFHKKEKVLEILDLMSMYKLNKFHFHLMDDEGWRLEIADLPELTEVGGTRGYTTDESDHLYPAYGSGGNAEQSYSTGYYTREDYIEILQYADARHIEVIPEIDLPGHARAAIIAMRARYNRLMKAGKKEAAEEYVLHDPEDKSEYQSAQNYNDNVINLCRESSYTFIEKVLRETIKLYTDAGVPLKTLHTGGDEVPYGAWQKSPMCQSFLSEMENLTSTDDLHPNMLFFVRSILNEHNIVTAGWEEIVLAHSADGHNGTDINQDLLGEPMLPYVWNASWGWGREDMAYKLANAGFQAVMCNSASYYFDLAYDSDPREGGLDWSGLTNAKTAFDLEPLDVMAKAKYDLQGNPLDPAYVLSKEKLTEAGVQNIQGIQGQLWSETLYNADLVDYMTFPKLFGLAQRAWSPPSVDPESEYIDFVNTIGQRELQRLDRFNDSGIQYRIPPPGIIQTGEVIEMNTLYPGLEIRYTNDGSEPTQQSSLYTDPISSSNGTAIKAKAYNTRGRSSRASTFN